MKCPICEKDVELQSKQIGRNDDQEPIFNEYAVCFTCKKQWNLDKQNSKPVNSEAATAKKPKPTDKERIPSRKPKSVDEKQAPSRKPKPVRSEAKASKAKNRSNSATASSSRRPEGKNSSPRKRTTQSTKASTGKGAAPSLGEPPKAYFRIIRIILGILSLLAFAYLIFRGFMAGLDSIALGTADGTNIVFIGLSICFLITAVLWFMMQKKATILAFILPMIFYLGGSVYAFIGRGGEHRLLSASIVGFIFAVLCLILALLSVRAQQK